MIAAPAVVLCEPVFCAWIIAFVVPNTSSEASVPDAPTDVPIVAEISERRCAVLRVIEDVAICVFVPLK
jgi:hypothetical protein